MRAAPFFFGDRVSSGTRYAHGADEIAVKRICNPIMGLLAYLPVDLMKMKTSVFNLNLRTLIDSHA